ncbi:DUF2946 domain-containing protein [Massilia atriviolacea]|uniref:DUF2946 domain-containing protein n=1 Tax=Massilia atriviolacea TaxID=2495579 RepID=A0A430HSI1_9BURK|nr:DUF2946 domain-containing protein [Massilia atriviolacea]RSZ60462.1 DUF2946 domain-containing protein [Massilia atriviolacea]
MSSLAKRQTLHLWIAFLAILFGALAPAIGSAAMASGTMEVCTSEGVRLIQVGDSGDASGSSHHAMQHCAFCTTHAGTHLPPAPPGGMLVLDIGRSAYPSLFYRAPQPLHAWSAANPRAPPLLA